MSHKIKKVAIIGPAYPLRGGIAQFNERLATEFESMGISTAIYSFKYKYPKFLFPGKTQFDPGPGPKGLTIRTIVHTLNPFNWFDVARTIVADRPDMVIFRYWLPPMAPCLGSLARLIKKDLPVPIVAITDNVLPHEKRPGDRIFTQYFVNSCDAFLFMSGKVGEELEQFNKTAPRTMIAHPVYDHFGDVVSKEEARKRLGIPLDRKVILFFGLIRKYKGLDLLLSAMAEPEMVKQNVHLLVAGEFYDPQEPYLKQIEDLGIADRVHVRNEFIPGDQVADLFCATDMIVQPYRTASQSGITQIGYHFGRPMLVTDVGGLPEMVTHNDGSFVCKPEPSEIARYIGKFYSEGLEKPFSDAIALQRERFSWKGMVNGIIALADKARKS